MCLEMETYVYYLKEMTELKDIQIFLNWILFSCLQEYLRERKESLFVDYFSRILFSNATVHTARNEEYCGFLLLSNAVKQLHNISKWIINVNVYTCSQSNADTSLIVKKIFKINLHRELEPIDIFVVVVNGMCSSISLL